MTHYSQGSKKTLLKTLCSSLPMKVERNKRLLDCNGVPCAKGVGEPIQAWLLVFTSHGTTSFCASAYFSPTSLTSTSMSSHFNTGKRDFLMISCQCRDQFSESYECTIINAVRRRYLQKCDAFDVIEKQSVSVWNTLLRDDALRYFTDYVVPTVSTVYHAFALPQRIFMTPAHRVLA